MKEIKYRMWNKPQNKMYQVGMIDFDKSLVYMQNYEGYTQSYFSLNEVELMKYTGLNDKNGKEIYEGDIILIDGIDYAYIYYDEDRMAWGIKEISEFYFDSPLLAENVSLEMLVVGNICENPELAKD